LEEKIEKDITIRKLDHGQLSKRKKTITSALEYLAEKKERRVGEDLKARKKWT
jgi:hypothetical protein